MNFENKRGHTPVVDFHQLNENSVHHLYFGVEDDRFTDRTKVTAKIRERKQGYKYSVDKATLTHKHTTDKASLVFGRLF